MSGPQFAHIQTFSRKPNPAGQSVDQVLDEVERVPEFSKHVDQPAPPRIVDGVSIAQLRRNHDAMVDGAATRVRTADGIKTRAIRKDRHTLLTMVVSYPVPWSKIKDDPLERAALEDWRQANIRFAKEQFGDGYQCSVEHTDEEYPHLHIYALPHDIPGIDAKELHPGKAAKAEAERVAKREGLSAKEALQEGNKAYKARMREWQDEYYLEVGEPSGLLREGPRRKRLSRAQYQESKREAKLRSQSVLVERHEQLAEQEAIAAAIIQEAEAKAASLVASGREQGQQEAALAADLEMRVAEARRRHRAEVQHRWDARRQVRLTARAEELDRRAVDADVERARLVADRESLEEQRRQVKEERNEVVAEWNRLQGWHSQLREGLRVLRGAMQWVGRHLGVEMPKGLPAALATIEDATRDLMPRMTIAPASSLPSEDLLQPRDDPDTGSSLGF